MSKDPTTTLIPKKAQFSDERNAENLNTNGALGSQMPRVLNNHRGAGSRFSFFKNPDRLPALRQPGKDKGLQRFKSCPHHENED